MGTLSGPDRAVLDVKSICIYRSYHRDGASLPESRVHLPGNVCPGRPDGALLGKNNPRVVDRAVNFLRGRPGHLFYVWSYRLSRAYERSFPWLSTIPCSDALRAICFDLVCLERALYFSSRSVALPAPGIVSADEVHFMR